MGHVLPKIGMHDKKGSPNTKSSRKSNLPKPTIQTTQPLLHCNHIYKMPPVQKNHEEEKHESMDEDILEAKPKKRKLKYLKIRREIMVQNMNDETSYTLPNTTIKEQSRVDSNFIGSAHYYFLNRRKVRTARLKCDFRADRISRLVRLSMVPT